MFAMQEAGFHACDASDFSGWDRAPNRVDNVVEIELHFKESRTNGVGRPQFTCNYCGDHFRTSVLQEGLRWFNSHDCLHLETAEALGIVYDLTDQFAAPDIERLVA